MKTFATCKLTSIQVQLKSLRKHSDSQGGMHKVCECGPSQYCNFRITFAEYQITVTTVRTNFRFFLCKNVTLNSFSEFSNRPRLFNFSDAFR